MISRYVPMGLLCILIIFGCSTIEIEEKEELVAKPQEKTIEALPVSLSDQVNKLIDDHKKDPKTLLIKLEEIIPSGNFEYNSLLARLYISTGEYQKGIDLVTSIPDYDKSLDNLEILTICQVGLSVDYTKTLDLMFLIDKKNIFALNYLAKFQLAKGLLDQAENNLFEVYYQDEENSTALILMGDLALKRVDKMGLEKKKVLDEVEEDAISKLYKRALFLYLKAGESNNPSYYVKLSNIYKKQGNTLDAIKSLDKAIELDPSDLWNYYDRGKLFFYSQAYSEALSDFKMSYSLNSDHFFTNVFLGRVNYILDNPQDALSHYEAALTINPEYFPAYKEVSILYYVSGDKESSLNYLIKLYKSKTDRDPFLPLYLVESLFESTRDEEAKKILQNLVKYEKDSTMRGVYNYYLNPKRTGDRVLNEAMNSDDEYKRVRLTYYVSCALSRSGVSALNATLLRDVSESGTNFESKLAAYKLGEI